MITTFAYDKKMSPLNGLTGVNVIRHKPVQYMALCSFNNVFWEFDAAHNYAPCLVFDGEVHRLGAIAQKFPNNVDTLVFGENKPGVQYRYKLNEDQMAELAHKGFWSESGVTLPPLFLTSKFQLETDVVVEEVINNDSPVPIYNVELVAPYENTFDARAYSLIDHITRCRQDENKVVENTVSVDVRQSMMAAVKEAEAATAERERLAQIASRPLTEEERDIRDKSANIGAAVATERDKLKQMREEGNAKAEEEREAEKARLEAEREALANLKSNDEATESVNVVETDVSKLTGGVEENKYSTNRDIFADEEEQHDTLPDKAAALLKQLNMISESDNGATNNDKRDDGTGAASGAQGLGVYTFEDQDTAQFAMRADEGHGNEKVNSSLLKMTVPSEEKKAKQTEDERSK